MLANILFLLLGLALILIGANALTDGASAIARRWGVSDLVIGLTVVAFGTSAPELVISIVSAINGSAELAIGNVVGSNIFNVLVIIGITAMVLPIKIDRSIMTNEIPLVILSALALLAIGNSSLLDGNAPVVSRVDGILLLLFFMIFMRYTFSQAKTGAPGDPAAENASNIKAMPIWKAILWVVGGLAGLIYGGDRFVAGASGIASGLGVSDAVIGLTIVAARHLAARIGDLGSCGPQRQARHSLRQCNRQQHIQYLHGTGSVGRHQAAAIRHNRQYRPAHPYRELPALLVLRMVDWRTHHNARRRRDNDRLLCRLRDLPGSDSVIKFQKIFVKITKF